MFEQHASRPFQRSPISSSRFHVARFLFVRGALRCVLFAPAPRGVYSRCRCAYSVIWRSGCCCVPVAGLGRWFPHTHTYTHAHPKIPRTYLHALLCVIDLYTKRCHRRRRIGTLCSIMGAVHLGKSSGVGGNFHVARRRIVHK